jgi:hypothetical protein
MITASEARTLIKSFDGEVDQYLKHNVEPMVMDKAASGECTAFIQIGNVNEYEHMSQKITPTERAVMHRLHQKGYTVTLAMRGTSDFGFSIRW